MVSGRCSVTTRSRGTQSQHTVTASQHAVTVRSRSTQSPVSHLHRGVPAKGAVAVHDVLDVAVAPIAVRDAADAGAVAVGEHHVLDEHPGGVVLDADVVVPTVDGA